MEEKYRSVKCPNCGKEVVTMGPGFDGAYECVCGQWVNLFGQALRPPQEWEEDFGPTYEYDEY